MSRRSLPSRSRRVSSGGSACTAVIGALDERHRNFVLQLARVRRRPSEPGVHDLRVATRRLIAVLDLVSDVVAVPSLLRRRKALRKFLKGCNLLRDAHIRQMALARLRPGYAAIGMVLRQMKTQESVLLRDMGRNTRAFDAASVQAAVVEAEEALLKLGMNAALESSSRMILMGSVAKAFARVVRRKELLNASDPATVHQLRVAFKKLRYSLEILSPLLPWVTSDLRSQMNAYQTSMGKVQDTAVVLESIAAFERTHPLTGRLALVEVRQVLLRRQRELLDSFLMRAKSVYSFWR
jgi:CHAD domain-containing protein